MPSEKVYELIIIGAGPAGITAGIYAARKKMDCLIITEDIGGQAAWSGDVENYTGYQFVTGAELVSKFEEHMKRYGLSVKENEKATSIRSDGQAISVSTEKGQYRAYSVIIASGKRSKQLDVPGEQEFRNKGLTYCATCDGPLFEGKDVAVIGGGNSALDAALQMSRIAGKVYLVNITSELGGDAIIRDKVTSAGNVTVMNDSEVKEVAGSGFVESIRIASGGQEKTLKVQGVFVEIGLEPNSEMAEGIEKNELGEILVNCQAETDMPGVFAAGDVTNVIEKQIIIAAGEGAKAALRAYGYLARKK